MIAIADFLDELRQDGVQLWLQDGKLRYRPVGSLDAARLAVLRQHRDEVIAAVSAAADAPATRPDTVPLSPQQQGIWFLSYLGLLGPAYQYTLLFRITGDLDVTVLGAAIDEIVRRHEILRTGFPIRDGKGVQVVAPPGESRVTFLDVSDRSEAERDRWFDERRRDYFEHRFDLDQPRNFYADLIRFTPAEHMLVLRSHHLVIDGPSLAILFKELRTLYAAFLAGAPSPLPEPALQYADYALWQQEVRSSDEAKRGEEYWRRRLADAKSLDLPTDRPRPLSAELDGAHVAVPVPAAVVEGLRRLAEREGVTLFTVLLTAFHTLLYRWSGQSDVSIGITADGRARGEVADAIGHFINTIVVQAEVPGRGTFVELLGQVRARLLEALEYRHVPVENLVAGLQPQRDFAVQPLFRVMFSYLVDEPRDMDGLAVTQIEPDEHDVMFDLMFFGSETAEGRFEIGFEYQAALFDRTTVERLAGYLVNLLAGLVEEPGARVDELPLMSAEQRHEVLDAWNGADTPFDADLCLHQLIERRVAAVPDATALIFGDRELTYRQLDERANALAWRLRELGVGPDDRVGVALPRSLDMVIANVAVLKAGGACVPIDPAYPGARRRLMIDDAALRLLIVPGAADDVLRDETGDAGDADEPTPISVPLLALDEFGEPTRADGPPSVTDPANIAWVLYTSGSTGRPKGIAMPHRGLVNQVQWQATQGPGGRGRTLQWSALSFDVCYQEILTTLTVGDPLVLVAEEVRYDYERLLDVIDAHRVERIFMPFVALQGVAELATRLGRVPSSLHAVTTAGEQLQSTPAIRTFFERLPGCTLYNQYGPIEVHLASAYELRGAPAEWPALPPIGRAFANLRLYVLDEELRLVPPGVAGELFSGGVGVARGYLGRPELTAERFLPDPFRAGERMYRTGDRARWNADGELEFLGRVDTQVKIRGFRVEVAEIEAALSGSPQVRDCAVAAHSYGPGDKRLVAYVVPDPDDPPTAAGLRAFLGSRLPEFMVPAVYQVVAQLPRTPSGKLSRALLPPPDEDAERAAAVEYEPPSTPLQESIAAVWAEVLAVPRVGVRDNFFDLGGHSLLAVAVVTRLAEVLGRPVPLRTLFEAPTVAGLSERLEERPAERPAEPAAG
ncbi:MAG TPA: amino acid adenylation domain-containing protein [Streptosporangiaceae bacterium]|nr:amino acid adenylation domain-containing protein [Streptosporangiaceae bacterium]